MNSRVGAAVVRRVRGRSMIRRCAVLAGVGRRRALAVDRHGAKEGSVHSLLPLRRQPLRKAREGPGVVCRAHSASERARARAAVQHGVLRGHSARSARRCARTADGAGGSPLLHTRGGARAGGEASEGQLVGPARARAARAWRKGFPARCARGCPQGHARAVTGWALHHSRRPAALRRRLRRRVPTPGCHRAPISERARPSSHPRPAHPSL